MTDSGKEPSKGLKRSLGLRDVILFGVGTMLGAGIYAIIGEAASHAGHLLWAAFLVAALIAILTGLSYAEFVSRFPDSGGSFEYLKQAFGHRTALVAGGLIFLTGVVAAAAIAISFAGYLAQFTELPQWVTVVAIIILMGLVNVVGASSSSGFNTFATLVTVCGLLAVVGFALPEWPTAELLKAPAGNDGGAGAVTGAVLAASALIFFSYVGFEDLVKMAEETESPRTHLPRAILISAVSVLVIYLLVAISAVAVRPPEQLASDPGPLAAVMEQQTGRIGGSALAVVALFATSKTILSNIFGTSRLLYDMARDTDVTFLNRLARVMPRFGTPVVAIAAVSATAILFGLIGNLAIVASISNLCVLSVFTLVNIGLVVWRWRNPDADPAPFTLPLRIGRVPVLPVVAGIGTLAMFVFNLVNLNS